MMNALNPMCTITAAAAAAACNSGIRALPIHCIVEELDEESRRTCVVRDMITMIPVNTRLRDLIQTCLSHMSVSEQERFNSSGFVELRNWKSLPLSVITDNQNLTVEQIFSDICAAVTFRIHLSKRHNVRVWTNETVRESVVKLLQDHTQTELAALCPLSQSTISYLLNLRYHACLSSEKCREFGEWFESYRRHETADVYHHSSSRRRRHWTKPRVTFHPTDEVPLLRDWFQHFPYPTTQDLSRFADELNARETRQERLPVTTEKLRIWWTNEKQRLRRMGETNANSEPHQAVGLNSRRRKSWSGDSQDNCWQDSGNSAVTGSERLSVDSTHSPTSGDRPFMLPL